MSRVTASMALWDVLWRLTVLGAGIGMFMSPNNNSVMSAVPSTKRGISSGLLGMFRYIGQSMGIAFSGTTFAAFASAGGFSLHGLPSPEQVASATTPAAHALLSEAFINGLHAAALLAIPLAGTGLVLSLLRGRTKPPAPPQRAASQRRIFIPLRVVREGEPQ